MPRRETLFLRQGVALELSAAGPTLSRRDSPVLHRLELREAIALLLFGQFGATEPVVAHLAALSDSEAARSCVASVLSRWRCYLGEGRPRPIETDWFDSPPSASIAEFRRSRESAPAAISWVVTLTCNRRCPYCYYKVLPWNGGTDQGPADATLTWCDVARMIDEMGAIGTSALYLTGGEPLLRPDLPRVIERAAFRGIRVFLNTKFAIDRDLAQALLSGGMCEVSYSLDAADAKVADALAGQKGYLKEAIAAISVLLEVGMPMRVNAVATSPSAARLRDLARLCLSLGVPELTISPYMEPSFARSAHSKLTRQGPPLSEIVAGLQDELGYGIKLTMGSAEAAASKERLDCSNRLLCEVGIRALDVLPDGRVTRCRYAPNDEGLIVGDLRSQSLMDIWNGTPLLDLTYPKARQFGDTACSSCGALERCNTRGRCVLGAKLSHGRHHAPDVACEQLFP